MSILDYHRTVDFGHEMTARADDRARRLRIADLSYLLEATVSPAGSVANRLVDVIADEGLDAATYRAIAAVAQHHANIAAKLSACLADNAPARQFNVAAE
jgi:hypothetical protein